MTSPQSLRDRLRNHAREKRLDFQLVLTTYGIERTLHRLGQTNRANDFVLKGAQLLRQYLPEDSYRASRDGDLHAVGSDDPEILRATLEEAAAFDLPDGLHYDLVTVSIQEIRENNQYTGLRAKITAELAGAQIPVQLDLAFGDATIPQPTEIRYRTLLDQPPPSLRGYAIETVIAEKLEAITTLGLINSRLKDYFDLWFITQHLKADQTKLVDALQATFERRGTTFDPSPPGLSFEYSREPSRVRQWTHYLRTNSLSAPRLDAICTMIDEAYGPALRQAQRHQTERGR